MTARAEARWQAAADEHDEAIAAYLDAAGALPDDAWTRPWAEGKWTPAEVTEHVTRGYEVLLGELRDGEPMRLRMASWQRTLSRWIILPHILFHRSFPIRAPAPREVRPGPPRAPRDEALRALREAAEAFAAALSAARGRPGAGLTHPYFGKVEPVRALRFVAIHTEHHRRQIERAAKR
jgi:hypothetical protein